VTEERVWGRRKDIPQIDMAKAGGQQDKKRKKGDGGGS